MARCSARRWTPPPPRGLSCDVLPAIDDIDCWDDAVLLLARADVDPRKRELSVVRFYAGSRLHDERRGPQRRWGAYGRLSEERTGGVVGKHADRVKRPDEPLISIMIPTLDEARVIAALLAQLEPLRSGCEIVFVDGGSSDGTRDAILDAGFQLVDAPRGRGTQLNAGACASSGEILFFLHADSALPPDPLGEIRRAMRGRRVGCFGVRFSPPAR